jgi:hypothetical protein
MKATCFTSPACARHLRCRIKLYSIEDLRVQELGRDRTKGHPPRSRTNRSPNHLSAAPSSDDNLQRQPPSATPLHRQIHIQTWLPWDKQTSRSSRVRAPPPVSRTPLTAPKPSSKMSSKPSSASWSRSTPTTSQARPPGPSSSAKCTPPPSPPLPPSAPPQCPCPPRLTPPQQAPAQEPPEDAQHGVGAARAAAGHPARADPVRGQRAQPGHLHARVRRAGAAGQPADEGEAGRVRGVPGRAGGRDGAGAARVEGGRGAGVGRDGGEEGRGVGGGDGMMGGGDGFVISLIWVSKALGGLNKSIGKWR